MPHALTLPTGLEAFERLVFIRTDHPGLQGQQTFPSPMLWLTLKADVNPAVAFAAVDNFVATQIQPARAGTRLTAVRFTDHAQALGVSTLSAWQSRIQWVGVVGTMMIVLTLLLMRWGVIRRELALRMACGQTRLTAVRRTARGYAMAVGLGAAGGSGIAAGALLLLTGVSVQRAVPMVGLQLGATLISIALMSAVLFGLARSAPLRVLNRGAL